LGIQQRNATVGYWLTMRAAMQIAVMEHNDRGSLNRWTLQQSDQHRITLKKMSHFLLYNSLTFKMVRTRGLEPPQGCPY